MNKYMHTINGNPAFFQDDQIVFAQNGVDLSDILLDSLDEIKDQQTKTIRFRHDKGFTVAPGDYSYLRIKT